MPQPPLPRLLGGIVAGLAIAALAAPPTAHAALPALPVSVVTSAGNAGVLAGNDVSWPQCSKAQGGHGLPLPARGTSFVVVGLTNGLPFTENPCLSREVAQARSIGAAVAAYTFAATPTAGQLTRDAGSGPYDAADPLGRLANAGYSQGAWAVATLRAAGLDVPFVWVDVEPRKAQPWSSRPQANVAVLNGVVRALQDAGSGVGFYSYASGWAQITGGLRSELPVWATAGHRGRAGALAMCAKPSFSGGPVVLGQYYDDIRDSDVTCPGVVGAPTRTKVSALAPWRTTVLRRGSSGPAVAALQARLGLPAHGTFNRGVALQVRLFQRQQRLPETGIVDRLTWRALGADEVHVLERSPGSLAAYFS